IYTNQQADVMSDLVLANIEALAKPEIDESSGVIVTCSKKCDDGIGRCWIMSNSGHCAFTGYQDDNCAC
ncbi:MAG: NVEALA domain-containing protein, partial [Bacteroides sp.]|nr:NVEALA domain-containing protein [Bacteroides sp.]